MNIKNTTPDPVDLYTFDVELNGELYKVKIWTSSGSSKFQDWEVLDSDRLLFIPKVLEDEIIAQIDKDWEQLLKQ